MTILMEWNVGPWTLAWQLSNTLLKRFSPQALGSKAFDSSYPIKTWTKNWGREPQRKYGLSNKTWESCFRISLHLLREWRQMRGQGWARRGESSRAGCHSRIRSRLPRTSRSGPASSASWSWSSGTLPRRPGSSAVPAQVLSWFWTIWIVNRTELGHSSVSE